MNMSIEIVGKCPLCGAVYERIDTAINRKDLIIDEVSKDGLQINQIGLGLNVNQVELCLLDLLTNLEKK